MAHPSTDHSAVAFETVNYMNRVVENEREGEKSEKSFKMLLTFREMWVIITLVSCECASSAQSKQRWGIV